MRLRISYGENSPLTSENIDELGVLANEAGFDFYATENTLIITQKMMIVESIRLNAPSICHDSMFEALTRAFSNDGK